MHKNHYCFNILSDINGTLKNEILYYLYVLFDSQIIEITIFYRILATTS